VIAAGFQGIDDDFNITTLGRGGSDTTAVALAAVLNADACEIYTDVDGVYTTDPRVLAEARRVNQISYDEMLELASLGAGVMHSRSIEFAKKFSVPIHVRSSFSDQPGTMIVTEPESETSAVGGAALTKDEARVSIYGVPDKPGTSASIFAQIADRNVTVDMIVQNLGHDGKADISFTVPKDELEVTLDAVNEAVAPLGPVKVTSDDQVSKVSAVGLGMATQTGVADKMFRSLADGGVNLLMITTSEIKISALVTRDQASTALSVVHNGFELNEAPADAAEKKTSYNVERNVRDAAEIINRLGGVDMEELFLDGISLDETQALMTINGVPDQPGIAAEVFEQIAQDNIFVDMIVQASSVDGAANLGMTIPREQLDKAVSVTEKLNESLSFGNVVSNPNIAKLSVSGIGLRSHTGVAVRMFNALAAAGINVEMINTSEVRVNVIVAGSEGKNALKCLEEAFADVLR
jgi:aspartate kinase